MKAIRILAATAGFAAAAALAQVSPLVVTKTVDDGSVGTLRNAITYANTSGCPVSVGTAPAITFNITAPSTGPYTIQPATGLPAITCTGTSIDGTTQRGSSANTDTGGGNSASIQIILNGSACGAGCNGLEGSASNVVIRGLSIHSFAGAGVSVGSGYTQLYGNYIGTDPGGMNPFPNGIGISVSGGQAYVGGGLPADRNLITGNTGAGVKAAASGIGVFVTNNQIGGRRDGSTGMGNGGAGVELNDSSTHRVTGNYIRYNGGAGILVNAGSVTANGNPSIFGNGSDGIAYAVPAPWPAPVITSYSYDGVTSLTSIGVRITGGAASSSFNTVDLYGNSSLPPLGEGQALASSQNVTTDASGAANVTLTVNGKVDFPTAVYSYCGDGCLSSSGFSVPVQPAVVAGTFNPSIIDAAGTTEFVFVVGNANTTTMTNVKYVLALPAPLKMSGAPTWDVNCGTGFSQSFDATAGTVSVSAVSLARGQGCTLHLPIQTPPPGTYTIGAGAMSVTSSFGIGQPTGPASLQVTQPVASATPASVDFRSVAVGSTASSTVTVNNNGTGNMTVAGVSITGTGFAIAAGGDNCTGRVVPPSSSATAAPCTVTVTFTPASASAFTGQLQITSNGAPLAVALAGQGTQAALRATPAAFDFGGVDVGGAPTTDIVLMNTGNAPMTLSSISVGNSAAVVFTQQVSPAPCGTTLAVSASCTVRVKFAPVAVSSYSGTVQITGNFASGVASVALTGRGTAQAPTVSPSSLAFGNVPVGGSASLPVTVTNNAQVSISISASLATSGFSVSPACPAKLAPSASCTMTVTFTPGTATAYSATLQVGSAETTPGIVNVPITGAGVSSGAPVAAFTATSLTFGRQAVGTTSPPQSVTLTNNGTAPLRITAIAISGDFGYTGCGFPLTLAPGASCAFAITFSPIANGTRSGAIQVTDDAAGSPHAITLAGVGANGPQPGIAVRPSALDFGDVRIGGSRSDVVTITSNGTAPLAIASISIGGAGFTQANTCPASLPVGGTCDVTATFVPAATGPYSATLTVASNGDPASFNVSLAGNGVPIPPAVLSVDRFLDFGQHVVNTTTRLTLDLRNTGEQALNVTSLDLRGAAFALEGACSGIAPGGICTVTVAFTPVSVATFTGSITIASNDPRGLVRVDVLGQGLAVPKPELELSVSGIGFSNQLATTTGRQRLTIRSAGTAPLHIRGVSAASPFDAASGCPGTLAVGAVCDVEVTFTPPVPGTFIGRLTIDSDGAGGAASVSLTGTGCSFFTVAGRRSLVPVCR